MYGGKNTLIGTSVDRREACSPDVILSKNLFFDSQNRKLPLQEEASGLFYSRSRTGWRLRLITGQSCPSSTVLPGKASS